MAARGTQRRSIRIADDLWEKARETAEAQGVDLASVIRRSLELYVEWAGAKRPSDE
jgi:hypothetical protein